MLFEVHHQRALPKKKEKKKEIKVAYILLSKVNVGTVTYSAAKDQSGPSLS